MNVELVSSGCQLSDQPTHLSHEFTYTLLSYTPTISIVQPESSFDDVAIHIVIQVSIVMQVSNM